MPRLRHLNLYTPLRKSLRNNATIAEQELWHYLRHRQLNGLKFRRQESIGRYIVDFYCPSKRLAIELDGPIHDSPDQIKYDYQRTKYLNACFIRVLRFRNCDVHTNIQSVLDKIISETFPTPSSPPKRPSLV